MRSIRLNLAWPTPSRSLAGRLALVVTGSVTAALLLAAALSIWREVDRYGAERRAALTAVAEVFASGSALATASDDSDGAAATLRAIGRIPSVTYGAIERADGSILTEQGLGLRLTRNTELDEQAGYSLPAMLSTRTLRARAAIRDNGRTIGHVVLVADTSDLYERIVGVASSAVLTSLFAVLIGVGVSLHLQRSVVRPLAALARTMESVGHRHDYTQRAAVTGNDEVGKLASTFNVLLGVVNERDKRLAEHGERLQDEVRIRTADLHEAKQAAESANAAKSSFLATMSHEIRTPMNGMLVMAELLAGSDLPARQQRYAQVIAQSGKSLVAIINDILDFAKVESGKLELERTALDPSEIADTVVTLFGERARSAGLDLAASVACEVPRTILGDSVRLGQVIGNFVSNALKFTQAGSVHLRLEMSSCGRDLIVSVSDTGIGIPQDKLSSIFSAFAQADQSTTRRFGGTGLGLSIAQRLVGAMGGSVGVESRVGVGSRFWARIPAETGDVALSPKTEELAPGLTRSVVLRVSGDMTRAMLAASLKAAGFEPTETVPAGPAHWILDAETLDGRPRQADRVVVLGAAGNPSADRAIWRGDADEILRWPVVQAEWRPLLAALAAGRPLARPLAKSSPRESDQQAAMRRFPSAQVLMADDSAVNREVAVEALARCGVRNVVTVEDGAAAVKLSEATPFDLILMDGSMPVLDGYAAARAIRRREAAEGSGRRVSIVALTADVLNQHGGDWQDADMDGFLAKPFSLRQLSELLQHHLGRESVICEAAAAPARPVAIENETNPPKPDLIDSEIWEGLLSLGDTAFVSRIAGLYRKQAPNALGALKEAGSRRDQTAIAQAAHSLKSMSSNIGARHLAEILKPIELAARQGICELSETQFAEIQETYDLTVVQLNDSELALQQAA